MFNLSRPVKPSKERRIRLPLSEAISPLKVAGEEHFETANGDAFKKIGRGKKI